MLAAVEQQGWTVGQQQQQQRQHRQQQQAVSMASAVVGNPHAASMATTLASAAAPHVEQAARERYSGAGGTDRAVADAKVAADFAHKHQKQIAAVASNPQVQAAGRGLAAAAGRGFMAAMSAGMKKA